MERKVFSVAILVMLLVGCSKDDSPKCDSCTSEAGNTLKICDNGNGTYDTFRNNEKIKTVTKKELEEEHEGQALTPKEIVELACAADLEF